MHLQALTMSTEHQGAVWQCAVLENIETLTTGNFKLDTGVFLLAKPLCLFTEQG